jgi:hypothetical protein
VVSGGLGLQWELLEMQGLGWQFIAVAVAPVRYKSILNIPNISKIPFQTISPMP